MAAAGLFAEHACWHGLSDDTAAVSLHRLPSAPWIMPYLKVAKGNGTLLPQGVPQEDGPRDAATFKQTEPL
jgi:hypothetical protein